MYHLAGKSPGAARVVFFRPGEVGATIPGKASAPGGSQKICGLHLCASIVWPAHLSACKEGVLPDHTKNPCRAAAKIRGIDSAILQSFGKCLDLVISLAGLAGQDVDGGIAGRVRNILFCDRHASRVAEGGDGSENLIEIPEALYPLLLFLAVGFFPHFQGNDRDAAAGIPEGELPVKQRLPQ